MKKAFSSRYYTINFDLVYTLILSNYVTKEKPKHASLDITRAIHMYIQNILKS